ncbi:TonB-dependent receptor [uncultured Draconibacterium sp.]|uniref:TonB-dependent receptor n=1 Tax=uncultured Draconibacterium sp. TaxID=1573823 RepID=UPI002AA95B3C|nr:TonB-dependent receptor [uncultured Draconibacterium sp.]
MKTTVFILLVFVYNSFAINSYSQTTKLNLDFRDVTVKDVLTSIENQSEFYFMYETGKVDVNRKVSISVEDKVITEILDELFEDANVSYKINNRQIALRTDAVADSGDQQITVSGVVQDTNDEPLPGVSVVIKGTTQGTITDFDGKYTIVNVPSDATLQFSFVGMKQHEVVVNGQSTIDIVMIEETIGLEEVVAIGYGTVKKSDLTGSVSSVKSEDLNRGAISSVDQAMQGRIAGVQVTQASNEPGGGLSIRIRGASSVNAGNEPLYVIDGLPIDNGEGLTGSSTSQVAEVGANLNAKNPLNALNPNDIQSIEILKDASATAIYGSRGANGVVLITTKKGSHGIKFSYDAYAGLQSITKKVDVLSASEYISTFNEMAAEQGLDPRFSASDISAIGAGTDWQDQIYKVAPMQSHNLSMSGGVEKTKFYVSLNYFDQDGVVKETGVKRYIARVNLDQQIGEKLKFGLNLNNSRENSDNYIGGVQTNESAGAVYDAIWYDPTLPVYNEDGTFFRSSELTINNPMSVIYGISSKSETNRMFGNTTLEYEIVEDLSAKLNVGFDNQNMRRDLYNSTKTIRGVAAKGFANIASLSRSNILAEYTMNYNKTINENQYLNVLGGVTYQEFMLKSFSAGTSNFPSDDLMTNNLGLGDPSNAGVASHKESNTLLSYLGRVNYSIYNFLLTASIRADGSSRFGENNKYGYFPSFALGWKLAEEDFVPEVFSELKLRASWGQTGNQEIGSYTSLSTYEAGGTAILDGSTFVGTVPSRIANPDLKWETTAQTNIGVDYGFLNGRITGSIDYFKKKTTDMLLNLPLPTSSGYSSILRNVGSMKNGGFEFMIHSRNIIKSKFNWNTTFNISAIKNEVLSLGDLESIQTGYIQVNGGNTAIFKPGLPLGSYYGYRITGIFQDQAQIDGSAQPTAQPGFPIFDDVNNDGQISTADQVVLGDPYPDFTYGLRNTFTYGDFDLDIFIQGQQGADLLNGMAMESMYPGNATRNKLSYQVDNRWTPENTDATWPSGINSSAYGASSKVNNLVIEDASYIRLKSVQLSYNVPVKIGGISSAKVYVSGQNLFTITDYTGYDPEANAFGQSNVKIDYSSYPLARTWMLGVNVQF